MKFKRVFPLALSAVLALSCLAGCGGEIEGAGSWNQTSQALSAKLADYQLSGLEDLTVGDFVQHGSVEMNTGDDDVTMATSARTVSHGNIYTAYVTAPVYGNIYMGDTLVVRLSIKNNGESATNFLVDIYGSSQAEKRVKDSWLTRNPIISPSGDYTDYYFYGIAKEDTLEAVVEINLGFAAQDVSVDYLQVAKYNGSIQERYLENLPLMSRKGVDGNDMWHTFYGYDSDWRTEAAQMLEENRKNNITVNVKDANGNPVSDAQVTIAMTEKAYHIGSSTSADTFLGEDADARFAVYDDYFNILTFANDLKWGDPNFKGVGTQESNLQALEYLADKGMDVHGHVLFWGGGGRDPYDDGVDNSAEFVTVPPFVVSTVRVMHTLMRMQHVMTPYGYEAGYGDGTIGTLRQEVDDAIAVVDEELKGTRNPDALTIRQNETIRGMLVDLKEKIASLDDTAITFEGLDDTLASFRSTLRTIILEHVTDFATYYGQAGSIVEWDVINEAMNEGNRTVSNALGEDAYMTDKSKVCQDQIFVDIFKAAREAAGEDVKLSYNDTSWQSNGQQRTDTYNFFKYLVDNNAPIDYFGLQAYIFPQSVKAHITPEEMWEEFDKFIDLGIQTEITEYSISYGNDVFATVDQLNMFKADFACDYMLVNYAHETSIGFIAWGGLPTSGPVASAWYKQAYNTLWTNETVSTANGTATVNGFLGDYQITVTKDGKMQTVTASLATARKDGDGLVIDIVL